MTPRRAGLHGRQHGPDAPSCSRQHSAVDDTLRTCYEALGFHQTPFSSVAARDSHVGGWNSLINKQQLYAENLAIAEGTSQ